MFLTSGHPQFMSGLMSNCSKIWKRKLYCSFIHCPDVMQYASIRVWLSYFSWLSWFHIKCQTNITSHLFDELFKHFIFLDKYKTVFSMIWLRIFLTQRHNSRFLAKNCFMILHWHFYFTLFFFYFICFFYSFILDIFISCGRFRNTVDNFWTVIPNN